MKIINFKYLLALLLCFSTLSVLAQSVNHKFGKPTEEEWALTQFEGQPDAEAVVLYKSMTTTYRLTRSFNSYSGVSTELTTNSVPNLGTNNVDFAGTTATYDCRLRTKILKESGTKFANVDVVYYSAKDNEYSESDEVARVKVTILSKNEKGKVQKNHLRTEKFSKERIDDFYCVLHIVVPQAKVGDIIEYQYEVSSNRVTFLYDWSFQEEELPVVYSKCDLDIPAMLSFNISVPTDSKITKKVEQGTIRLESTSGDMQAAKSYPTNHYLIEGTNLVSKSYGKQIGEQPEATGMTANKGKVYNITSSMKNTSVKRPAPMSKDKQFLMINPK